MIKKLYYKKIIKWKKYMMRQLNDKNTVQKKDYFVKKLYDEKPRW